MMLSIIDASSQPKENTEIRVMAIIASFVAFKDFSSFFKELVFYPNHGGLDSD